MTVSKKKAGHEGQMTLITAKFFKFAGEKLRESDEPVVMMEEEKEVLTRFDKARIVLSSNPFYESPIGSLQSMEDIIKIKNTSEVRDQLRALREQQSPLK